MHYSSSIQMGISIGNENNGSQRTGTLGGFLKDSNDKLYLITNEDVIKSDNTNNNTTANNENNNNSNNKINIIHPSRLNRMHDFEKLLHEISLYVPHSENLKKIKLLFYKSNN